jgi:predicted small secreted protein
MERVKDVRKARIGELAVKLAAAASLALGVLVLEACNTTEGVGKDVKSLGKGIEESAQDAKN